MNIEIGIGIGESSLFTPSTFDRLIAYAWASVLSPNVSTSSVIHKTVNTVIANSVESALAPSVSTAGNAIVLSVVANANGDALIPIVAIAGAITVNAVVANSDANSIAPAVSTIRNVLVNGVVTDSIASADVPTVSTGSGGTTYYLQLDGVDDYIAVPSFSFDEVTLDFSASQTGNFQKYLAINDGAYVQVAGRPIDNWETGTISSVYINDVLATINTDFVPYDTRVNLRALRVGNGVQTSFIFRNFISGGFMQGRIYDVAYKLAGIVVAHYDMSTGTVLDQSGNGNHATLTGGTWVAI